MNPIKTKMALICLHCPVFRWHRFGLLLKDIPALDRLAEVRRAAADLMREPGERPDLRGTLHRDELPEREDGHTVVAGHFLENEADDTFCRSTLPKGIDRLRSTTGGFGSSGERGTVA